MCNVNEGEIGVCGIAVLDNFSCGILVMLILNCSILQTCGMQFFGILDGIKKFLFKSSNVFRAFSSFRLFHFLLIISQHATECYLFCLLSLSNSNISKS